MFEPGPERPLYEYITADEADAVIGAFRMMMDDEGSDAVCWVRACRQAGVMFSQWQMERKVNPELQGRISSIDEEILEISLGRLRASALHSNSGKAMKLIIEIEKVRTVFGASAGGNAMITSDPFALSGETIKKQKEKFDKQSLEKKAKQIASVDEASLREVSGLLKDASQATSEEANPMKREVIRGPDA